MTDDIAIAHKDYDVRGGGEILAERLARAFDAPLFVGRRDLDKERDDDLDIREIDYDPLPEWLATRLIDNYGITRSAVYQLVWQQVDGLTDFETVIMSGNEPLWWVPEDHQTVLAYTHSTPRWQYDLFPSDVDSRKGVIYHYLSRVLYDHNVRRPDLFVANSERVARRIQLYWGIPDERVRVVYPPVAVSEFDPTAAPAGDYFLCLGRLAGHKRTRDVVRAFDDLGDEYELVVAGRGPEGDRLREMAGSNVRFAGFVSEDRKRALYAGAKALVYPCENEDFGMVPVEAMAAGTPVIGVKEGFTEYQVRDGENGLLWPRERGEPARTIREFEREGVAWGPDRIAAFARQNFGIAEFRAGMREAVAEAREMTRIDPDLDVPDVAEPAAMTERAVGDGGRP